MDGDHCCRFSNDTLTLVALFASSYLQYLPRKLQLIVKIMVYVRKDVEDNSETIVRPNSLVWDYHKGL